MVPGWGLAFLNASEVFVFFKIPQYLPISASFPSTLTVLSKNKLGKSLSLGFMQFVFWGVLIIHRKITDLSFKRTAVKNSHRCCPKAKLDILGNPCHVENIFLLSGFPH